MWTCQRCQESVEETFDTCWQCGASRDGTPDPSFVPERESQDQSADEPQFAELVAAIAERYVCEKCSHRQAKLKKVATTGTGLSRMLDMQHNQFLVITCAQCGYSEFYDAHVLGTRNSFVDTLDFLFGG